MFGIGVFCLFLVLFCFDVGGRGKEIKRKPKEELENVSSIQQVFIKSHLLEIVGD